jgi:hypothetical protein
MSYIDRPHLAPKLFSAGALFAASFFLTSCIPGTAISAEPFRGCVVKEVPVTQTMTPEGVMSKHRLIVNLLKPDITVSLESHGNYSNTVENQYSEGDLIALVIYLRSPYSRGNPVSRAIADSDNKQHLEKILNKGKIVLDPTGQDNRLALIESAGCTH